MQYVDLDGNPLRRAAEDFEDIQRVRIRLQNRDRAYDGLFESDEDKLLAEMFETFNPGAADEHRGALKAMIDAEKIAKAVLLASYRECVTPAIQEWQAQTKGIGEHMLARLLGIIGNPYIATPLDWEGNQTGEQYYRSVGTLWAYCGHGAPSRRTKGMTVDDAKALGNTRAKMLVHLMAESVIKLGNVDYRIVYDDEKTKWLARSEDAKGKKMTKGHAHNHALRVVGKTILLDLWVAAREDAGFARVA